MKRERRGFSRVVAGFLSYNGTQGSDESAMPSHRNVKYISLGGLSHIWCSKSMANRCSPGARESEEALVSRTGEDGGGEQAEGISLG